MKFCFSAKTISSIKDNYRLVYSISEMPMHSCVPDCTKKGYREEDGSKASHFQFPSENMEMDTCHQARRRKRLKNKRINKGMFQTFQKRRSEEESREKFVSNLALYHPYFLGFARRLARESHRQKSTCAVFTCGSQRHQLPLLLAHADRMLLLRVSPSLKWKVLLRLAAMLKWRL